jgi:MarR family transcriptional regulator, organic hydroperoxide resistance regulator
MEKCELKYCGCLYYSSNALARILTKMADEAFAPIGITSSYAFLLMSINEKPGIQPTELSKYMQLTPSTVTRLIEKMEYRGLVERRNSGRITEVFPKEGSLELQPKIKECWKGLYAKYAEILGKEVSDNLTRDIRDVLDKLI